MPTAGDPKPELSYVLAATTTDEVHKAAAWLRQARLSERVEIVLAAPGRVFGLVAGRVIPSWVRLASAENTPDRKVIQVAGARQTTGAVVIVVSCGDDLETKVRDPFATEGPTAEGPDSQLWAGSEQAVLPASMVEVRV
jgi:hypothetical protein